MTEWLKRAHFGLEARFADGLGWRMLTAFLAGLLVSLITAGIAANVWLPEETAREWISALAGWVGGAGALLAAALTLPTLRRQAAEAKRQTDFAVGDADPEIEVGIANWQMGNVTFNVVNWNRRKMRLHRFYAVGIERPIVVGGGVAWSRTKGQFSFEANEAMPPIFANGWRDRGTEPEDVEGRIWLHDPKADGLVNVTVKFVAEIGLRGRIQTIEHVAVVEMRRPTHG